MTTAVYNELEPFAVAWLRNLIAAGHIAPGVVDDRSIAELEPADVAGVGQRHFFAGIAGWSAALRLAGVPDDASIWTGSCPCQPFSDAGRKRGVADDRHLWPEWFRLIRECRPAVILGEQVASRAGRAWLDLVFADLEGCGYACGAADLPAAGVGAPHRRQRLFFVAHADGGGWHRGAGDVPPWGKQFDAAGGRAALGMAYADGEHGRLHEAQRQPGRGDAQAERCGEARGMANPRQDERRSARSGGSERKDAPLRAQSAVHHKPCRGDSRLADPCGARLEVVGEQQARRQQPAAERGGETHSGWDHCDWIPCSDGVARPVEPGTHPLVTGLPGRVGLLRGYGNAIVPQIASAFIRAALNL